MKFWFRNILMNSAFAVSVISTVENYREWTIIEGIFLDIYIYCIFFKKSTVSSAPYSISSLILIIVKRANKKLVTKADEIKN